MRIFKEYKVVGGVVISRLRIADDANSASNSMAVSKIAASTLKFLGNYERFSALPSIERQLYRGLPSVDIEIPAMMMNPGYPRADAGMDIDAQ